MTDDSSMQLQRHSPSLMCAPAVTWQVRSAENDPF